MGLPGTGRSYGTSVSSGNRHRSTRQIAADHRRLLQERQRELALAEIQRAEAELAESLSVWREQLEIASPADYQEALAIRPFENEELPPPAPDFKAAERRCIAEAAAAVARANPLTGWRRFAGASGGMIWAAMLPFDAFVAPILGLAAGWIAWRLTNAQHRRRLASISEAQARSLWSTLRPTLQVKFESEVEAFYASERAAQQAWQASEQSRIEHVRRLLAGDAEAVEAAVSAALESLDFPFETECSIAVDDEDHVLVDVDLPEIEDVIPETECKVLKNGTTKEGKRKAADSNRAYAELVCGIALSVGATALSSAPTLTHATVAGRTQRQKRGSVEVEDAYVFEVKIPRDLFGHVDAGTLDPVELVAKLPSRLQVMANGSLKKLRAPEWATAMMTA